MLSEGCVLRQVSSHPFMIREYTFGNEVINNVFMEKELMEKMMLIILLLFLIIFIEILDI